jgi:hypothetical protein
MLKILLMAYIVDTLNDDFVKLKCVSIINL